MLVPEGKIAMGKLSQAIAHGATLLQVDGNFDDCLTLARKLAEAYPVELVNSVNPARIEGQKTAAFEIVDALGDAPDIHCLPVGNAGNITAYWRATASTPGRRAAGAGHATCRACGASRPRAPPRSCSGHPVDHPETIATAIRIGNPASWAQADAGPRRVRRPDRGRHRRADPRRAPAALRRARASSSSRRRRPAWPGCSRPPRPGCVPAGARIVCTVTGHGLKDPQWALRDADGAEVQPDRVPVDAFTAAGALGLEG